MTQLTRRAMVAALAATGAGAMSAAAQPRRPNILFCLADDWSWQSALAVDELGLKMPAMNRIARDGVFFENAFAAAPSCTASRGAILTGRPPWQLEEGANLASILPVKFGVYPDLLERAGYAVGYAGKGWAPGQLAPAGRVRNPAGPNFKDFAAFMAQRQAGAPFCFWLGSADPHRPFKKGQGAQAGVRFVGAVPPYLPDAPAVREDIADYMLATERFDSQVEAALALLEAAGELDNTLVVMTGDNGWAFPRGKATLYDAGTHVPLVAMWPARIRGGQRLPAPVTLTDLAPTFLEAAGVAKPSDMAGASLLSVMTGGRAPHEAVITAMERHMDGHTEPLQGYPMRALRTDRYLYIRNFHPERWPAGDPNAKPADIARFEASVFAGYADIDQGPAKAWMAVNRDDPAVAPFVAKAMGKRPAQELYDVKADPYELTNLANDPKHRSLLAKLDAQLMSRLKRLSDPRATGAGEVFDYPSYSDPGYGRPTEYAP